MVVTRSEGPSWELNPDPPAWELATLITQLRPSHVVYQNPTLKRVKNTVAKMMLVHDACCPEY